MADDRSSIAPAHRPRVLSFESRRAAEMRTLIEKRGGVAQVAPSMREVPLDENAEAFAFAEELLAGRVDVVIFLTGVGARTLLETVERRHDRRAFFDALDRTVVVVRGPKPTAVLREWGVRIDHRVPEPNTWRELLATLDAAVEIRGRTLAVQEYGQPNEELYRALEERGARALRVPVYRWALPDDIEPLRQAVRDTLGGGVDVLLFTSAEQVRNVLRVAESEGARDEWVAAASRCRIASIGPTCSEAIREAGLPVHVEASPPKMGRLVLQALADFP
ncbi:MAG: uroporphyrinogen-III synthase [Planctomycetales bacterium]